VDYTKVCEALLKRIAGQGGKVLTNARVTKLTPTSQWLGGRDDGGGLRGGFLVNCAGLHCDRVSELAGEKRAVRIVPFRGEYYKLKPARSIS